MNIPVFELARRTGYCRQWLNRFARLGEIPGCTRKPSGRLEITDSPELDAWIARMRAARRYSQSRRQIKGRSRIEDCGRAANDLASALHRLNRQDIPQVREQIEFIYKELKRFYEDV